jgi:hypothetical protein
MNAHPLTQCGCDTFGIDHGCIRRDIAMQVLLMNPAEGTQLGPKRCAGPFTGVAVHLTPAVALVITGPFADPMADGGMGRMAAMIALPFIGVEDRALLRDMLGDQVRARRPVRMVAHPKPLLPRLTRDDADDGRPIIGVGAVPPPRIGAAARRIAGVARGPPFFPRHSGRVQQPQRRYRPSPRSVRSRSRGLGHVAAAYGAAGVTPPTPARGVPGARPWQCRAATGPALRGAAECSQNPSR